MSLEVLCSKLCCLLLSIPFFTIGCNNSSTNSNLQVQCRINSDCPFNQYCEEGLCENSTSSLVTPKTCEDDQCTCSTNIECPESYYCDPQNQTCTPMECQISRDCELGKVCIQYLCVTDLNADRDRDGVPDAEDSCPFQANPDQEDHDGDLIGDRCDPDDDNDQIPDYLDNCVFTYNPKQGNADADTETSGGGELLGNACDLDTPGIALQGQLDLSILPGADPTTARVYIDDRIEPLVVNPDGSFTAEIAATEPGRLTLSIRWFELAELEEEVILPDRVELFQIETPLRLELLTESRVELRGMVSLENEEDASRVFVRAYLGGETLLDTFLTDDRGIYVLSVPKVSPLLLKFSADGYIDHEITLEYNDEESTFTHNGEDHNEEAPQRLSRSRVELSVSVSISPVWLPRGQGTAIITINNGLTEQSQVIESGRVVFNNLVAGIYQVEVQREGFDNLNQLIELSESVDNHIDFTLVLRSLSDTNLNFQGMSLTANQLNDITYLPGANLNGVILRNQDLCGMQLREVSLVGADLSGVDLSGADLSGAHLDNSSLVEANLSGAKLTGVSFFGANLTRATLKPGVPSCGESWMKTDLSDVNFSSALLEEVQLTAELPPLAPQQTICDRAEQVSPTLHGVYWTASNLNRAQLKGLMLSGVTISGVSMRQADLSDSCLQDTSIVLSDLSAVNLSSANLYQARFINTVFTTDFQLDLIEDRSNRANFRHSNLAQATITGSNLSGADFREINGVGLTLRDVILTGADFSSSNLQNSFWRGLFLDTVNLFEADLFDADLRYIQILESNLEGATLERANLLGATLNEADLRGLNMKGSNLTSASLYNANLEDADLSDSIQGEEVVTTRVIGTQFTFARYNTLFDRESEEWISGTKWPTSFSPIYIGALGPESILTETFFPEGFQSINANLTRADFGGSTMNNVDFSYSNLTETKFRFKSDLSTSTPVVPINHSDFSHSDFTRSEFLPVNTSYSNFRESIFQYSQRFSGTFSVTDFTGSSFTEMRDMDGYFNFTIFDDCTFNGVNFTIRSSQNLSFNHADFTDVNFRTELSEVDFTNGTLEAVTFHNGVIDSDFTNSTLEAVTFHNGVIDSDFTNTTLTRVTFNAYISGTNFEGVDFSEVTFSDITMTSPLPCPIFSPNSTYICDSRGIRLAP